MQSHAREHSRGKGRELPHSLDAPQTVDFDQAVLDSVVSDEEVGLRGGVRARTHFESVLVDFLGLFVVDVELF